MLILLVDDDRSLVDLLAYALRLQGFESVPAYGAAMALEVFEQKQPDLVVLDLNLGIGNGLDVLKALRTRSQVPVIILTAADGDEDKVRGLNLGADDYVTKPYSHNELIARIRANLRRVGIEPPPGRPAQTRWEVGPIVLDTSTHSVFKNGRRVSLTLTEFRLLFVLIQHAGTVVSTATLLEQVWGDPDTDGTNDVVRVTVYRLRHKLEDDPTHPELLHTISGVGFLFGLRP